MNKMFLAISALAFTSGICAAANAAQPAGGFQGPGLATSTVAEAQKFSDDTAVVLVGKIEKSLGNEEYQFKDATGTIVVEIDDEDWNGVNVTPQNTIEIHGEVDKDMFNTKIDAERVILKK